MILKLKMLLLFVLFVSVQSKPQGNNEMMINTNPGGFQYVQSTDVISGTGTGSQVPNSPVYKNYVYQLPDGRYINLPLISDNNASPPIVLFINGCGGVGSDLVSNGCAPRVPTSAIASINGGGIGR